MTIGNFELKAKIPLPDGVKANPMTLGDHIKKARFKRKLQQIELARMLNVDYSTVRRWEDNEVRITPMYLERVQGFLGYSI